MTATEAETRAEVNRGARDIIKGCREQWEYKMSGGRLSRKSSGEAAVESGG